MKDNLLLNSYLRALRLPTMLKDYSAVARQCAQENLSHEEFLERLAEREVRNRGSKATERRLKQAGFPGPKELADFQFSAVPKLKKQKVLDLSRGEFIGQKANVILLGAPGVGKPQPTQYPSGNTGMRRPNYRYGSKTPSIRQDV